MISLPGPIPIRIQPLFFLMAAAIGWFHSGSPEGTAIWIGIVFVSVLVHELGHALTAIFFGQKPIITLVLTGGLTSRGGKRLQLWQEFVVVLNGPLFGMLLAFFAIGVRGFVTALPESLLLYALDSTILANIFWSFLNLLPVGPLDGAMLVNIGLEGALGSRGVKIGYVVGTVTGVSLGLFAMSSGLMILGVILLMLSFESFRAILETRSMTDEDRSGELQELYQKAEGLFRAGDKEQACKLYKEVQKLSGSGLLFAASTERVAQILSDQGEFEEAFALLSPLEKRLSGEALRLFHRIAYYMRDADVVVRVGDRCFQEDQSYETAFVNALAYGLLGRPRQCVGWLRAAQDQGMPKIVEGLKKREFDGVRSQEAFVEFVGSLD